MEFPSKRGDEKFKNVTSLAVHQSLGVSTPVVFSVDIEQLKIREVRFERARVD